MNLKELLRDVDDAEGPGLPSVSASDGQAGDAELVSISAGNAEDVLTKHVSRLTKAADDGRIVGGNDTSIQAVPYQVYILLQKGNDYFQCGGSIINKRNILTAAHCLTDIQKAYVRAGSTDSNDGGQQYESRALIQHPMYNPTTSDYDVGIIKLLKPIKLDGTTTKAVKLAPKNSKVEPGTDILVSGWGTTSENGNTSTNLMSVIVPVVSNQDCSKSYSGITSRMFCAGVAGKDSCQGDSGGPAVSNSDKVQRGIVSFGIGCAREGYPGVYTRVAAVRSWIDLNSLI
ncbi:trypsin-like [Pectinophora gossypiella]|uniref:trypsin-like n=1 Tax=Pectinophora gossypiella TaxID=13191 RepID=UPI00214F4D6F|nr:trypsin-like [Pectinophora gossypiella]